MKTFVQVIALAALLSCSQAFAQSAKPTQESLNRLFELTEISTLIPTLQNQMDGMMNNLMQDTLQGKAVTPEQQKALDTFRSKVSKIQKEGLSWELLQPQVSQIYQNSLSQEDVDGMIAFYQSPAGRSFVKKMPVVMQQTMQMMQTLMVPMMKKIEAAGVELRLDLQRVEQK